MRHFLPALALLMVSASCSAPAPAPAAPAANEGTAPAPAAPSGLFEKVGQHHHAMTTTSADAQRFFNQGFNFVFGFNHEQAAKSFARAAALDPKAAMPH